MYILYPHTLKNKAVIYVMFIVKKCIVRCFVVLVYNNLNKIIFKVGKCNVNECYIQHSAKRRVICLSINLIRDEPPSCLE
jgi:hypothetical protein